MANGKTFGKKVDAFFSQVKKNPLPYLAVVALCIVGALFAHGDISLPGGDDEDTVFAFVDGSFQQIPKSDLEEGWTKDDEGVYRPAVKEEMVLAEIKGKIKSIPESDLEEDWEEGDDGVYRAPVDDEMVLAEIKGKIKSIPESDLEEDWEEGDDGVYRAPVDDEGAGSADFPILTVVDGREISDWKDSEYVGLSSRIVLRNDELVIQGSKGAITWDSLRNTDEDFQKAYFGANEDRLGEFLINKISFWAGSVLRYENEDGDEIALLVKVDELDYRLWRITDGTRSIPSSKDDLYDVQYVYETALTETRTTTTETTDRGYTSRDIADTGSSDSGTSTRGYTSRT